MMAMLFTSKVVEAANKREMVRGGGGGGRTRKWVLHVGGTKMWEG